MAEVAEAAEDCGETNTSGLWPGRLGSGDGVTVEVTVFFGI